VATYLIHGTRLLGLHLVQLFYPALDDLAALFHACSKGRQRLLELRLHLAGNMRVCLGHALDLAARDVERHSQRTRFAAAEGLAGQTEQLPGIFFFDGGAGCGPRSVSRGFGHGSYLTRVKSLQFVVGDFGIVHSFQQRGIAGVIFPPEVIRDCAALAMCRACPW
jgi:hypothetical protein